MCVDCNAMEDVANTASQPIIIFTMYTEIIHLNKKGDNDIIYI